MAQKGVNYPAHWKINTKPSDDTLRTSKKYFTDDHFGCEAGKIMRMKPIQKTLAESESY